MIQIVFSSLNVSSLTERTMCTNLDRRQFLKTAGAVVAAALPACMGLAAPAPAKRPNIVLIMADDVSPEVLGCYGGTTYKTPNIDKLAETGTRFTHCYSSPVCASTRVKLLTGRYGFRNYQKWGYIPDGEVTFGHVLKDTPAGRVCHDLVDFSDFMPTLAELAGAKLPTDRVIDGMSFVPQIKGQKGTPRKWAYCQWKGKAWVRNQRWKLYRDGRLYDIKNDPLEESPIRSDADTAEMSRIRNELSAVFNKLKN